MNQPSTGGQGMGASCAGRRRLARRSYRCVICKRRAHPSRSSETARSPAWSAPIASRPAVCPWLRDRAADVACLRLAGTIPGPFGVRHCFGAGSGTQGRAGHVRSRFPGHASRPSPGADRPRPLVFQLLPAGCCPPDGIPAVACPGADPHSLDRVLPHPPRPGARSARLKTADAHSERC